MGACALAGVVFALAAPPTDAIASLWVGMAFFAVALYRAGSWRPIGLEGGARGMAFGAGANVMALRFVPAVVARFTPLPRSVGVVALMLLALFEGTRWAVAGIVTRAAVRAGAPRALGFAAGVFAGTFVPTVFPWTAAGGATPWPAMIQFAEWIGERGVTFLMALTAGLVADSFAPRHGTIGENARAQTARPLALAALVLLTTFGAGRARMATIDARDAAAPHVRVALVQPSTEALERWDAARAPAIVARLNALTREAETTAPGRLFTVWPEAAYPYPLDHAATRQPKGDRRVVQPGTVGPVLAGVILRRAADTFNSAAVMTADGSIGERQDKIHLLWFGETLPFADRVDWIRSTFSRALGHDGRSIGLTPGTKVSLLHIDPDGGDRAIRAAVLNCFEDTLPDAGRAAARAGPNLLVNVTNDAWFVDDANGADGRIVSRESELHLRLAVLRAVETRRDLVRAVNVGPTTWISASGRVRARYDFATPGFLIANPALHEKETMYASVGDAPLVAVLLAVAAAFFIRKRTARLRKESAIE